MAQSLAESFLADLDELSDVSENEQEVKREEAEPMAQDGEEVPDYSSLATLARLRRSERYQGVMAQVHAAKKEDEGGEGGDAAPSGSVWSGASEEDPAYRLLVDCNALVVEIDTEIAAVHAFTRDKYRAKFPELASLVHGPVDYARVVKRVGNEEDMTLVELDDLLPQAIIMVVVVTASTTAGKPLGEADLATVREAAEEVLQLDADKAAVLELVQRRMRTTAPNLSAVVDTEVAARLMGVAGGLRNLSAMPACNVQVLGAKRKTLAGFSTSAAQLHQGFIAECSILKETPPKLRSRALRLLGAKCTLCARKDAYGEDPSGTYGVAMRAEILKKVEKWQEAPPAKQARVLPVPDLEPKKRRGGAKARKYKERYGLTETKKAANRVNFNQPEEEILDGDDVVGLGVLGKEGSGRLRTQAKAQKQKLSAKAAKKFAQRQQGGPGGAISGLSSSLAFTPVQGIELENPNARASQDLERSGTESYFNQYTGFRSTKT